jgi:hypothetical protein
MKRKEEGGRKKLQLNSSFDFFHPPPLCELHRLLLPPKVGALVQVIQPIVDQLLNEGEKARKRERERERERERKQKN